MTITVGNLSYESSRSRRLVALARSVRVESETDKGMGLSPGFGHLMVRRMTEALSYFTKSQAVLTSFFEQATEFVCADTALEHVKKAKAFCTWFRAVYLESPIAAPLILDGAFEEWARPRLREYSFQNCYLWSTFYMFKNCAEPVDGDVVDVSLQGHSKGVRGPDTATDASCNEAVNAIAPLLEDLARRVEKAYQGSCRPDGLLPCEFPVTSKGSLDFGGLNGGQVSELLIRVFGQTQGPMPRMPFIACNAELRGALSVRFHVSAGVRSDDTSLLNRLMWRKWGRPDGSIQGPGLEHVMMADKYEPYVDRHSWDPNEFEARMSLIEAQEEPTMYGAACVDTLIGHVNVDTWESYPRCREFWVRRCNELLVEYKAVASGEWTLPEGSIDNWEICRMQQFHVTEDGLRLPVVRVVAVREPLKVRVITISAAITSLFATWWQKTVHGIMQGYPCFKLLGRSPTTREVDAIRDFAIRRPGELLGYASSDFSGASNGTPERFRLELMAWINKYLPADWRWVPELCNGRHWIHYPKLFTSAEDTEQVTGTLMGEKTSFPILSLQVLATHMMAVRRHYGNRPSFWRALKALAVNGDDRLAYTTKELDNIFWSCCRELQFSESVGKSYWHPVYANINSQSYSAFETGFSVKTGYFASGLYFGQKKLATDVFDPCDVVTTILDSCQSAAMEHDVLQSFLKHWRKDLRVNLAGRNLFIPCVLGGVGHRPPNPFSWTHRRLSGKLVTERHVWHVRVSDNQQTLASELYWLDPQVWIDPPCQLPRLESLCRKEIWDTRGVLTYWDRKKLDTNECVTLLSRNARYREVLDDVYLNLGCQIPKLSKDKLILPARRCEYTRHCERTFRLVRRGTYASDLLKLTKFARGLLVQEVHHHIDANVLLRPRSMSLSHRLADTLPPVWFSFEELGFGNMFYKSVKDSVRNLLEVA